MKPSNFDSSFPNRSGVRQVGRSVKKFSGSMLQGIGRAIDRARLVSSSSGYIRETPGGTAFEAYDQPETLTPFRVELLALRDGKVFFRVEEGRVFGALQVGAVINYPGFSVFENAYPVRFHSSITETSELAALPYPGILDNRNRYTFEANLAAGQDTVIFVDIRRGNAISPWDVKLRVEARDAAETLALVDPIECEPIGEITISPTAIHNPFTSTHTASLPDGSEITLTQASVIYEAESGFIGSAQIPVAYVRPIGDSDYELIQILRSDIFFPYSATFCIQYIDTAVIDLQGTETEPPSGEPPP